MTYSSVRSNSRSATLPSRARSTALLFNGSVSTRIGSRYPQTARRSTLSFAATRRTRRNGWWLQGTWTIRGMSSARNFPTCGQPFAWQTYSSPSDITHRSFNGTLLGRRNRQRRRRLPYSRACLSDTTNRFRRISARAKLIGGFASCGSRTHYLLGDSPQSVRHIAFGALPTVDENNDSRASRMAKYACFTFCYARSIRSEAPMKRN